MRIAPDSKTAKSPLSWSTIVGMRPFGLSATYQSSFCSFLLSAIGVHRVRQLHLLERDGRLPTVGRGRREELDHGGSLPTARTVPGPAMMRGARAASAIDQGFHLAGPFRVKWFCGGPLLVARRDLDDTAAAGSTVDPELIGFRISEIATGLHHDVARVGPAADRGRWHH